MVTSLFFFTESYRNNDLFVGIIQVKYLGFLTNTFEQEVLKYHKTKLSYLAFLALIVVVLYNLEPELTSFQIPGI